VVKREEIYWGSFVHKAPDAMVLFNSGWQGVRNLDLKRSKKHEVPKWSGGHDGAHDSKDVPGLLAIIGSEDKGNHAIRANLYDLAPTILSIYGIPIPVEMDGVPLSVEEKKLIR